MPYLPHPSPCLASWAASGASSCHLHSLAPASSSPGDIFIYNLYYLFIFGWTGSSLLHGLFSSAAFSLVMFWWLLLSWSTGCRHTVFSSHCMWASVFTAHDLSRPGHVGFPEPGTEIVSPALQHGFLTTGPPRKPSWKILMRDTITYAVYVGL